MDQPEPVNLLLTHRDPDAVSASAVLCVPLSLDPEMIPDRQQEQEDQDGRNQLLGDPVKATASGITGVSLPPGSTLYRQA